MRVGCSSAGETIGLGTDHHGSVIPVQQLPIRGRPRDGTHCRPDNRWIRTISPSQSPPPICTPSQMGGRHCEAPALSSPSIGHLRVALARSRLAQLWSARLPKAIAPRETTLLALPRCRNGRELPAVRLLIAFLSAPGHAQLGDRSRSLPIMRRLAIVIAGQAISAELHDRRTHLRRPTHELRT